MILAALITYLLGLDLGVGVYSEAPSDKSPNEYNEYYYVLEQTGSSTTNQIVTTTIAIQSYAPSLLEAMVISKSVPASCLIIEGILNEYSTSGISTKRFNSRHNTLVKTFLPLPRFGLGKVITEGISFIRTPVSFS